MTPPACLRRSIGAIAIMLLGGCHERETPAQLQAWIDVVRDQIPEQQSYLAPQSKFTPLAYQADTDDTPFGRPPAIAVADHPTRPQQRGAPQVLEEFPLEALHMVGTISQAGRHSVLLQVDRVVYQAKTGDYLGRNFGMILRIAEHETELEELVAGTDGRWTARSVVLPMRGENK